MCTVCGCCRYGTDPNDGTFLIGLHDWLEFFTHVFACVVFPKSYSCDQVDGEWSGSTAGGRVLENGDDSGWRTNPKYDIVLEDESEDTEDGASTTKSVIASHPHAVVSFGLLRCTHPLVAVFRYATIFVELTQADLRLTDGIKYYKGLKHIGLHLLNAQGELSSYVPGSLPRVPQPCVPVYRVSARPSPGSSPPPLVSTATAGSGCASRWSARCRWVGTRWCRGRTMPKTRASST